MDLNEIAGKKKTPISNDRQPIRPISRQVSVRLPAADLALAARYRVQEDLANTGSAPVGRNSLHHLR